MRSVLLAAALAALLLSAVAPVASAACEGPERSSTNRYVAAGGAEVARERGSYDEPECHSGSWRAVVAVRDTRLSFGVSWFEERPEDGPTDGHAAVETPLADAFWDRECVDDANGNAAVGTTFVGVGGTGENPLCALPDPGPWGHLLTSVLSSTLP